MLLLPLRLDLAPHLVHRLILYFNPRTPVGCAPVQKYSTTVSKFQSTHPSGVRPGRHRLLLGRGAISIHAPREGCDRGNGLRIPRYGHSDHSLASIVLYNPLASPPDTQICRIEIPANHPLLSYQTARRTYTVFKSPQPWCEQPGTS